MSIYLINFRELINFLRALEGDDVGSRKDITTFFQGPLENNVMVNSLQMIGRSKSVLVRDVNNFLIRGTPCAAAD